MSVIDQATIEQAHASLRSKDKVLKGLIEKHGALSIPDSGDSFTALVNIIIGQQLSGKVATVIQKRLGGLLRNTTYCPDAIQGLSGSSLRDIGISKLKTEYILSLAATVIKNREYFSRFEFMQDSEIENTLVRNRGVGVWSARIFLLFHLRRANIYPQGDASLNKAIEELYSVSGSELERLIDSWSPYRTFACLHLWRYIDEK